MTTQLCVPCVVCTIAGKLEAATKTPTDLQQQLQHAQQQNQTLARILADRCEQAAAHVEQQHQLQDVWQQLLAMQAVPSSGTVQVHTSLYLLAARTRLALYASLAKQLSCCSVQERSALPRRRLPSNPFSAIDLMHPPRVPSCIPTCVRAGSGRGAAFCANQQFAPTLGHSQDLHKTLRVLAQEQGIHLKQQLAAVFDQLRAKDTQLSAMHQQLQAQHAQPAQRAQQALDAQHAQQHVSQSLSTAAGQEAVQQSAAGNSFSYPSGSLQAGPATVSPPAAALNSSLQTGMVSASSLFTMQQPQLQIATTSHTEFEQDGEDGLTPRRRFVKQRVQELQSRQSSPEKTLSSMPSRLNSPRAGLPGSVYGAGHLQQSKAKTATADVADRPAASSPADGVSMPSSPSKSGAGGTTGLNRISASPDAVQNTSASLQVPLDAATASFESSEPLPWGGGLEVGSPGMELPSDSDSDLGADSDDEDTGETELTAHTSEGHMKAKLEQEDSAQFGPEASAMSLPGGALNSMHCHATTDSHAEYDPHCCTTAGCALPSAPVAC